MRPRNSRLVSLSPSARAAARTRWPCLAPSAALYPYLACITNQAGVFEDRFRRTLEVADRPAPAIHGHSLGSVRAVEIARGESRHAVPHFSLIYPVSARMFGKSDVDRISGRTVGIVGEHKGQ